MHTETRSRLLGYACGAAVGVSLAMAALPLDFIAGNRGFWDQPKHDFYGYLIAWSYFVADEWRLPLLDVPAMGYPEGGNLIYSDALPIAQIASKAVRSAIGAAINPLGWWVLLSYALQGAMAARVVRAAGVHSRLGWIAGAILATAAVPFMARVFHVALSSHFLLLWALALYLEDTRSRRLSRREHLLLSALALLTSAYLFVMAGVLQAVTVAALASRGTLHRRDVRAVTVGMTVVAAIGLLIGYGSFFADPLAMRASGFGTLSWNPATLVLPPVTHWDHSDRIPRMAGPEQAEGESYIGLGALLVVVVVLVARPRQALQAMARQRALVIALLLFVFYAASSRVFVGPHLLLDAELPSAAAELVGFFRASGRFIWVPMYALVLLSLSALVKWCPARLSTPVVIGAFVAQLSEVPSTIAEYRTELASPMGNLLDVDQLRRRLSTHQRLYQFPSFSCQPPRTVDESLRELQIQLVAARLNVPNNSIYTARHLKDCAAESSWALDADLDPTTLYVVNKTAIARTSAVAALASSPFCVDVEWALMCSRQPLTK